jgi:phosphohistidine phosphatase
MSDWQRPLNERGLRDAPRAGAWLRERALVPDVIITSDAVRARTTAAAVAEAIVSQEMILEPSLYHATPHDVIEVLRGVRTTHSPCSSSATIPGSRNWWSS